MADERLEEENQISESEHASLMPTGKHRETKEGMASWVRVGEGRDSRVFEDGLDARKGPVSPSR